MSVDVEDYFHIEAAHGRIDATDRRRWPWRVCESTARALDLMAELGVRGTFFVLGQVALAHPALVRRIAAAGHEVGCHGWSHDRLDRLTPADLRAALRRARGLLQDLAAGPVVGYRAPTFSLRESTSWAVDVLAEVGFTYDSSVFPVVHPQYGVPWAPDRPYRLQGWTGGAPIAEVPPLTWRVMGRKIAVAGGGYLRLLPLWMMNAGLRQARRDQRPAVLYIHPWELDELTPRMPLGRIGRLRTYTGLGSAAAKLARLVRAGGRWGPAHRIAASAAGQPVILARA